MYATDVWGSSGRTRSPNVRICEGEAEWPSYSTSPGPSQWLHGNGSATNLKPHPLAERPHPLSRWRIHTIESDLTVLASRAIAYVLHGSCPHRLATSLALIESCSQ